MNIYDIAREAGVSISTVSRVVNGKTGVKNATRQKVESVIRKYNYFSDSPDTPAKNQARTVAILLSDAQESHQFGFPGLIERYLNEHNCLCVLLHLSCAGGLQQSYLDYLRNQNIDGIVILGSAFQTPAVKGQLQQYLSHVPIVMVNGWLDLPNVYSVQTDDKNGVKDCVSALMRKGRKNVAYVSVKDRLPVTRLRLSGYEESMKEWGRDEARHTVTAEHTVDGGYRAVLRLMKKYPQTDGLIFAGSAMAAGGLQALRELGLGVPEQVSVISLDSSPSSEMTIPRLTVMDNKVAETCWVVAQVMVGCMMNDAGAKKLLLPCELIERESS